MDKTSAMTVTGTRPLSLRRRLAFLSIPFLLFGAVLLAIEVHVRSTRAPLASLAVFVRSPGEQANFRDRQKVSIFEGDPLLFWRLKPDLEQVIWDFTLVSTNAQALRHPRRLRGKRRGGFRLVALGDSVTFGYRVPVVWPERPSAYDPAALPYPMRVEKRLRQANPGRDVEVVAMAVPGYTSHQGLAWLRRDIDALDPDVVTICFGWNDVTLRQVPDRVAMPSERLGVIGRGIAQHSQALLHLSLWLQSRSDGDRSSASPGHDPVPRVGRDEYVSNLVEASRLARSRAAAALLIGPVFRDPAPEWPEGARLAEYRQALRQAAAEAGLHYLEIERLTEAGHPGNADLFGERIHPNHLGHRLMADEILGYLARHGLLGGLNAPAAGAE